MKGKAEKAGMRGGEKRGRDQLLWSQHYMYGIGVVSIQCHCMSYRTGICTL